jgi:uncharacterized membrane protein
MFNNNNNNNNNNNIIIIIIIIRVVKIKKNKWAELKGRIGNRRVTYVVLVGVLDGKR